MELLKKIWFWVLIYLLSVALACSLWRLPEVLFIAYLAVSLSLLLRTRSRADLGSFLLAALLGPLAESPAIVSGAWQYSHAAFVIPIWLPLAWGIAGLLLKKISEALVGSTPLDQGEVVPRRLTSQPER